MNAKWITENIEAVRHLRSTYRLALEELEVIERKEASLGFTKCQRMSMIHGNLKEALARAYEKRPGFSTEYHQRDNCPLCIINGVDSVSCDKCPWVVFDDNFCVTSNYHEDPFNIRLDRLNEWEKRLLEMRR